MRRLLFSICILLTLPLTNIVAQNATHSVPLSIGRSNCGLSGGRDSVYFFRYVSPNLTKAPLPASHKPKLRIGNNAVDTARFTISVSTIQYNPKDQKLYYMWTNYALSPVRTYVWRWRPDTTFSSAAGPIGIYLDTLRSFAYDIGGVAFDNNGTGWTLEFPSAPTNRAFLRPIDFAAGIIGAADTLDFIPGPGGIGSWLYNVGSGDITMSPGGQMFYNFDNKLYTPDYASYGGPTRHIKSTFIDTTRRPTGTTALVGLAYSDGDIIAAYSPGCNYKKINPLTGDTSFVNYTYGAGTGIRSVDMAQVISGVGVAKSLGTVTPTGPPNIYDVTYDVLIKNYGGVPVTNVMARDSLGAINGNANVSNVSLSFVGTPPPGFTLNPAYNGTTNTNLILPGGTLKNYPVDSSFFTIRISCRLSNIQPGVIYNNSAVASGNGFTNWPLRDSSTNGSTPDLNQNDKPDDFGENQPTPLIIVISPITAPCSVLDTVLYSQTFGTGGGMSNALPAAPSASTQYVGASAPVMGIQRFTITDSSHRGDPPNWVRLRDHTGNAGGRMMVVNADAANSIIYRDTMPISCPGQQYSFSFWVAFIGNSDYQTLCNAFGGFKYPRFLVRARDLTTGLVIVQYTSDSIVSTSWQLRGMRWIMPSGYSNFIIEILNAGQGGCGNDFAIDDIQYGICDPLPTIVTGPQAGCLGGSTTFTSTLTDAGVIPGAKEYQWQVAPSASGPWTNISGATSSNYTINPVTASDTGKFYRVHVAAVGNIGNPVCQYTSLFGKLAGYTASLDPASITKSNNNNICPGKSIQLTVAGGTLGLGAKWYWYKDSCTATVIDSGASIIVSPTVTTTYFVKAIGYCNTTACVSVTVTISCDIDKDDDGLPDYVESNIIAALQDANSNGIINAFDPSYAGYIDNNNDFINDNFQADGDSDNDGIQNSQDATFPGRIDTDGDGVDDRFDFDLDGITNMLDLDSDNDGIPDTVEAYGAESNGDGRIDNYTDTDNDGLSQNVDFNNTGANVSGVGLGRIDLDNDSRPNFTDIDSDNDGIPDMVEAGAADLDNNGIVDVFSDLNNDGISDAYLGAGAILLTGTDINSDGRADSYPNDNLDIQGRANPYDVDSDGDGIVDVVEAGFNDTDFNGIIDGAIGANGWSTVIAGMPGPLNIRNTDADVNRDYLDIDSDNDGITDNIEGLPTVGYLLPGSTDTDNDGLVNTYDGVVGFSGDGIIPFNFDGDALPDYRDLDTDADGMIDQIEGNDFNFNRLTDDNVTLTGLDTDGDGLDNRFDSATTSPKVTSYNIGNGGSFAGDPAPGTRSVVQRSYAWQTDRDWRYVGAVLPVDFLQLYAIPQNGNVVLNWTVLASKEVSHFEVERSTDNINFSNAGTVNDPVALNIAQSFGFTDDISQVNSTVIFYRIKVVGKAGEIKYSNIIVVRLTKTKTPVTVSPNPAKDFTQIRFFAEKETTVTIRLVDDMGKTVLLQTARANKGSNILQLNGLTRYTTGMYTLQLMVNNDVTSQKLIITN